MLVEAAGVEPACGTENRQLIHSRTCLKCTDCHGCQICVQIAYKEFLEIPNLQQLQLPIHSADHLKSSLSFIHHFDTVEYWHFDEHLGCASGSDFWIAGRRKAQVVRSRLPTFRPCATSPFGNQHIAANWTPSSVKLSLIAARSLRIRTGSRRSFSDTRRAAFFLAGRLGCRLNLGCRRWHSSTRLEWWRHTS
jgi:hypothetical protein